MKFYVAARYSDKEKVKEINKLILSRGYELSGDWTDHVKSDSYEKQAKRSKNYAIEDIDAVMKSDVFMLLLNEKGGTGSSTELGAAIALNSKFQSPKIYIVGDFVGNNMFNFHPSVKHRKTVQEIFEELQKLQLR